MNSAKKAVIEVNLLDLINDIRNMSYDEVKTKGFHLIAYSVRKILDTNKERQQGKVLEILTRGQLLDYQFYQHKKWQETPHKNLKMK